MSHYIYSQTNTKAAVARMANVWLKWGEVAGVGELEARDSIDWVAGRPYSLWKAFPTGSPGIADAI